MRKLGGAIAVDTFEDSRIALLKVSRLSMSRAADPGCRLAFHPSRISRDSVEFVTVLYRYRLAMVDRHGWVHL